MPEGDLSSPRLPADTEGAENGDGAFERHSDCGRSAGGDRVSVLLVLYMGSRF